MFKVVCSCLTSVTESRNALTARTKCGAKSVQTVAILSAKMESAFPVQRCAITLIVAVTNLTRTSALANLETTSDARRVSETTWMLPICGVSLMNGFVMALTTAKMARMRSRRCVSRKVRVPRRSTSVSRMSLSVQTSIASKQAKCAMALNSASGLVRPTILYLTSTALLRLLDYICCASSKFISLPFS